MMPRSVHCNHSEEANEGVDCSVRAITPHQHVFVAGFQYHDGALVFDKLKVGTPLQLVPERDNPHDANAMALTIDDTMIGYVPRDQNALASLLDYYGHNDVFEVRVLQVNPEASPWEQLRVGLYVKDAR